MTATVPISQLISLEGRRALVTGAASGIGRAIATRLDEAGAALILVDKDAEALAATAATFEGEPPRTEVVDLTDKGAIDALGTPWPPSHRSC